MPKIPTGTDLGLGEVRTDPARIPRQNFQTNADQFGAGNGRALVNVSKSLQKALADLREADQGKKQDEAAAQRAEEAEMTTAESNARDAVVTLNAVNILGEGNAKAVEELKARPRTATETAALAEQAKAGLLGIGRDAGAGLTIPRQQENFTEFYLRRLETATAEIDRHVAERTAAKTAALMNSVTAREFETAVANFHDARAVRSAKLTGAAAIELGMAGQDPAAIKAAKNDFGSAIDTAIAAKILDDDPELGREFTAPPATPPTATRRRSSPCAGCPTAALAATDPRLHQNRLSAAEDRGFRTDSPFHMRFQ